MLVIVGTVSADTFPIIGSYDGTDVTGQITFDENGIINGGVIAGVTNGDMDVWQGSCQDGGNLVVGQSGGMAGESGFAATLIDDGDGNQGGTLASFTGGSMVFGQLSAGGEISGDYIPPPPFDSSGNQISQVESVVSDLNGVIAGQCVGIAGSSGFAATGARNGNVAYALSTASFTDGSMNVGQISGAGEITSLTSPGIQIPVPDDIENTMVFSSQGGGIQASSGSASTSGRTVQGVRAGSDVSFTDGSICFGQWVRGDSTTFSEGLGLGEVAPWSNYEDIRSYQSVDSESFSTIAASSYSQLPDGSFVQVNAAATGSGTPITGQLSTPSPGSGFYVDQSAGSGLQFNPLTSTGAGSMGAFDSHQLANENVLITGVESGSAGAGAGTSDGNTASTSMYVNDGSLSVFAIIAETNRYDLRNLLGDGLSGPGSSFGSEVNADYLETTMTGNSGGIRLDAQNSFGDSAHQVSPFIGSFTSHYGVAHAGFDEDHHIMEIISDLP